MRKGQEAKSKEVIGASVFCRRLPRQGHRDNCTRNQKACQRGRSTGVWQTWNFPLLLLICNCRKLLSIHAKTSDEPKRNNQGVLNCYQLRAFSSLPLPYSFFWSRGYIVLFRELPSTGGPKALSLAPVCNAEGPASSTSTGDWLGSPDNMGDSPTL